MTRIILESSDKNDLILIKELAKRLKINYRLEKLKDKQRTSASKKNRKKELSSIDISNFGNPTEWQRNVRADRNIGFGT
ncbi:MAG TPA: hypothetical protein PK397_07270 [Ignavibacteriaceae bacterium]|jgi:hypothetical protein|nr:hypothetical protein [Ignavibacteriaceae bacterium]